MSAFPTQGARPVWIASYPRSGNTYLRILLQDFFQLPSYSVYYVEGDNHPDPSAEALEEAPRLPGGWRQLLRDSDDLQPIAIKTHDLPTDSAAAIFIFRDGRAAIHSYYHYHKKFSFEQPSLSEIIAGACQFGNWSDHYWAWNPKRRPKTLLLNYDELVSSPLAVVEKLARFLNLTPQAAALPQFAALQQRSPAFFRRGPNCDYLSEWTPEQLAFFNQLHGSAMQDLGFAITESPFDVKILSELAQSAAHLHRKYIDELTSHGRSASTYRKEVDRLSNQVELLTNQVRDLTNQIEQVLKPQLSSHWVRLGKALGAVKAAPSGQLGTCSETTHAPGPSPSGNALKSSDGNTRLSARALPPRPLSGPNGDASAPA